MHCQNRPCEVDARATILAPVLGRDRANLRRDLGLDRLKDVRKLEPWRRMMTASSTSRSVKPGAHHQFYQKVFGWR
jgi:hypothetical protein